MSNSATFKCIVPLNVPIFHFLFLKVELKSYRAKLPDNYLGFGHFVLRM